MVFLSLLGLLVQIVILHFQYLLWYLGRCKWMIEFIINNILKYLLDFTSSNLHIVLVTQIQICILYQLKRLDKKGLH